MRFGLLVPYMRFYAAETSIVTPRNTAYENVSTLLLFLFLLLLSLFLLFFFLLLFFLLALLFNYSYYCNYSYIRPFFSFLSLDLCKS